MEGTNTDELQWLLAEAWNRGVAAFRESKLEEAESWIATAFSLSGYAAALAPWREEVNEGCECLRRVSNAPELFDRAHAHGSPLSRLQTKSASRSSMSRWAPTGAPRPQTGRLAWPSAFSRRMRSTRASASGTLEQYAVVCLRLLEVMSDSGCPSKYSAATTRPKHTHTTSGCGPHL